MGLSSDQTITVNAAARTYKKSYVARYAKELAKGNCICLTADITDGVSILRISHDTTNGVNRHLVSIEDRVTDTDGKEHVVKEHRVLSAESSPAEETNLTDLSDGLDTWMSGAAIKASVINSEL